MPDTVQIRPASTVMLVRDAAGGPEVFTLQRVSRMAFAAGMTVFPGGGVDAGDGDPGIPWSGPGPGWWADRWGIELAAARGQVVAAVRELYEETGVLLAGPKAAAACTAADRAAVTTHRMSLAALLRGIGAQLRADLLRPWARWITPPGPPRRYDTYFFLAALPEGQRADHATSEAADGGWHRPGDVLRAGQVGEVGLMPPTVAMLTDLADAESVGDLLAVPRYLLGESVPAVTPTVLSRDGEVLRVRVGTREYRTRLSGGIGSGGIGSPR